MDSLSRAREFERAAIESRDVNEVYQIAAEVLDLGNMMNQLPRLVVFGQQSMGKTTLLDALLGGPIGHVSSTIGTKMPVQILMKPSRDGVITVKVDDELIVAPDYDLYDSGEEGNESYTSERNSSDGRSMKPTADGSRSLALLAQKMQERMAAVHTVQSTELKIEITAPNAPYILLVDLPGLKMDDADANELTQRLVREFVSNNPNNLYVLVRRADEDPDNWHYSVQDFVVGSERSPGLGLHRENTITVCTRAAQFLEETFKDVKTVDELYDRAVARGILTPEQKRLRAARTARSASTTASDESMQSHKPAVTSFRQLKYPVYLVELFSMDAIQRNEEVYEAKRAKMKALLKEGNSRCSQLLSKFQFDRSSKAKLDELFDFCGFNNMVTALQGMMNKLIERTIAASIAQILAAADEAQKQKACFKRIMDSARTRNVLDDVRTYADLLHTQILAIHTGAFKVRPGSQFIEDYSGTLWDDLEAGHQKALEYYGEIDVTQNRYSWDSRVDHDDAHAVDANPYPLDGLQKYGKRLTSIAADVLWARQTATPKKTGTAKTGLETLAYDHKDIPLMEKHIETFHAQTPRPEPNVDELLTPGQLVRYVSQQKNTETETPSRVSILIGYATGIVETWVQPDPPAKDWPSCKKVVVQYCCSNNKTSKDASDESTPWWAHSRPKAREAESLQPVIPLSYCRNISVGDQGLIGWRLIVDDWMALEPVMITNITVQADIENPFNRGRNKQVSPSRVLGGFAIVQKITFAEQNRTERYIHPAYKCRTGFGMESVTFSGELMKVSLGDIFIDHHPQTYLTLVRPPNLNIVGGEDAMMKVTNHLCFKRLRTWLANVINVMPMDGDTDEHSIAQQTRGQESIEDANIVDSVMASTLRRVAEDNLIPLITLAACSAGAACHRILLAGYREAHKRIPSNLMYLCESAVLHERVNQVFADYVRNIVHLCRQQMIDAIGDACSSINKSHLPEIFAICSDFVEKYLNSDTLVSIPGEVAKVVRQRQAALEHENSCKRAALMDACELHFWVARLQLRQTAPQKLTHCFLNFQSAEMSNLCVIRAEHRPDSVKHYLREQLTRVHVNSHNEVSDYTNERHCERLMATYSLSFPDHTLDIKSLEEKIEIYHCSIRVVKHLIMLMNRHQLTFLQRAI